MNDAPLTSARSSALLLASKFWLVKPTPRSSAPTTP
jgi:hypothetical protein